MSKTIKIGGRIESAEQGGVVTGANAILDDTKGKKQNVINSETDDELARLDNAKQDVLTFDNAPTEGSNNPVKSGGVYAADAALQQAIEAILQLIPSAATALNQLADKAFVNSTEATNTATFRGTYNVVTDLSLHFNSTHQEIATALLSVVQTADNNDYCFVQIPVSDSSGDIRVTERYKFNGTAWSYEYDLNNSGFTADQWAAINSTITLALVQKLGALPTAAELAQQLATKQNTLTFDAAPVAGSDNPVKSGGLYNVIAAINATIPSSASLDNKLVAESRLTQYVAAIVGALDATFNVTSTDGHVNVRLTQVDGAITSVEVQTNDIASEAALNTLTGRVTTNEGNISLLQAAYNALQQSAPVIVEPTDTWPVANPSATVIYRVIDRVNTPPQYYSDYMWNGTAMVLMATYNNAIDPRPKKGSQNLVTSGGVFDNMGALDVSELNATENPHTLVTYADLSAALAAIPSDYQKGGMSIKFVQSSDNKYVQFRYMGTSTANADFANTDNWSFCGDDVLVENPEFVDAKTDAEGKLLEGIKKDGTKFIGCDFEVNGKIKNRDLDNKIESKQTMENGKGLINEEYADSVGCIENPEWLDVIEDENGVILEGHYKDGSKYIHGENGNIFDEIDDKIEKARKEGETCFSDKTAVWIGTSIPTMGYPQLVGEALNMTVHNEAIGSSMCRTGRTTRGDAFGDDIGCADVPWQSMLLSLSMTQAEKNRMFKRWTTEGRKQLMISEDGYTAEQVANVVGYGTLMGGSFVGEDTDPTSVFPTDKPIDIMSDVYIDLRQYCYKSCWNNSLNIESGFGEIKGVVEKYLNESDFPDYWFFDHGHNDGLYQDTGTIETIPSDQYDRSYLIGSFNFICKKILEYKKDAKIIFVGHYTNKAGASNNADKVCNAQEKVSDLWQYDILKCWKFLPFSLMLITTNGYWDANHVWHDSGYDGTNHVGHDQNKRQIDGVWYHDLTMKQMWMWDDLHPWGAASVVYANGIIYNLIKK